MKKSVIWYLLFIGLLITAIPLVIVAVSKNESAPMPMPTMTDGPFYYNDLYLGADYESDADGDWITDRIEYWQLHSNPLSDDSDGDGINDFNEVYTYPQLLDPLDPADANNFLALIPNIKAEPWSLEVERALVVNSSGIIDVAKNDPLVQWYAERTTIEWEDSDHTNGLLLVSGEPFFLKYEDTQGFNHPSRYLTDGRIGTCGEVAYVQYVVIELMGYDCLLLSGWVGNAAHSWVEVTINGQEYVVSYNVLVPTSIFYETNNWVISSEDDP